MADAPWPDARSHLRELVTAADIAFLLKFLDVPSVSPLEGGDPRSALDAQRLFADHAGRRGFRIEWLTPDQDAVAADPLTPVPLREHLRCDPTFLAHQPVVIARRGAVNARDARRIVFNFHVDTVGPHVPPHLRDNIVHGRGALDDKGPGVALLAGVATAAERDPALFEHVEVLICSVPGEEGGAMGVPGTKVAIDHGCTGRLMVFAEPTNGIVLDRSSASMTWEATVSGDDSTDDFPYSGHNATLALSHLATSLAEQLDHRIGNLPVKACLAGMHTGHSHNRVFGTGRLLVNFTYTDATSAADLRRQVHGIVHEATAAFRSRYGSGLLGARLARDWHRVVRTRWLKAGLPTLDNRDAEMELVLGRAGLVRDDRTDPTKVFTCDAIWAADANRYVVVFGPGDLETDGAHTPAERLDLGQLQDYATRVADLVREFAKHVVATNPEEPCA